MKSDSYTAPQGAEDSGKRRALNGEQSAEDLTAGPDSERSMRRLLLTASLLRSNILPVCPCASSGKSTQSARIKDVHMEPRAWVVCSYTELQYVYIIWIRRQQVCARLWNDIH